MTKAQLVSLASLVLLSSPLSTVDSFTTPGFLSSRWLPSSQLRMAVELNEKVEVLNPRLLEGGLSQLLDEGTRKSHSMAENSAFVTGFFKGVSNKNTFAELVKSLYFIYETMETTLQSSAETRVIALDYPTLRRTKSLETDMEYFFGSNWKKTVTPSPATTEYCEHIKTVGRETPYLLVAHQYTRYLGDLFGGQMMGGMATKSLNLEKNQGTAFYNFESIPNTRAFINEWYTTLNGLDFSEEQRQNLVDEANLVFRLNIGIFNELEGNPASTAIKLLLGAIKDKITSLFKK
jgi:heme oxygenase (biliverdin-producing, ferredoxin)